MPSRSHHCARSGPSISMHLHPYPQGPSAFQGASVLPAAAFSSFPLLCSTPAGSRGFPHWSCLGQNQHCSNDNAPKPAGCGPCPFGRLRAQSPALLGLNSNPGHTWPLLESRTAQAGNSVQNTGSGDTSVGLLGRPHTKTGSSCWAPTSLKPP